MNCTSIKKPEELIDKDLINLLSFIKRLPDTSSEEIQSKSVEFGELIRHKTLIWDLDETLVHAEYKLPGHEFFNSDFEIVL